MTPVVPACSEPQRRPKKTGRPRKTRTSVVNVRISDAVYDAYCRVSVRSGVDVRTIMRHVLTLHAPSP